MKRTYITLLCSLMALAFGASAHEALAICDGWTFRKDTDSIAAAVHLPHSWNADAYSTRNYYRGGATYSRTLTIPERINGRRLFLKFDGAANRSDVFIDGLHAGSHIGGYSPHILEITQFVGDGNPHEITVKVDNSDPDIPPYSADFSFMGGLYRDAWLIAANPVHLDFSGGVPVKVATEVLASGLCRLDARGRIAAPGKLPANLAVEARLLGPGGEVIADKTQKIRKGNEFSISFPTLRDISLWHPDSPSLYSLHVVLKAGDEILDETWQTTGFRTFAFDDRGRFLVNGEPLKLRGMCRHQDKAPFGIALTDAQHRHDMQLIKDLGANFIRISHYPQDDAILEMCDRLGLIAWEEIPVIDFVPDSPRFADNAETMLRDMIRFHRNHPSVAMWGYMNEILLRPSGDRDELRDRTLRLARRLEEAVRDEDPGRLTAMAFHGSDVYNESGLAEVTDIKGWNLYSGWYGGNLSDFGKFLSGQHAAHPDHRLIVSEYGAGSDLRLHSLDPRPFDFSMEYQQRYLEHYLPVIEDSAFVAGASHWNFIDFSSANRAESMPHINNKGLVTNSRRPKDVYHYYRAAWHNPDADTVAYIASRDWPHRTELMPPGGHVVRPIKIYTNLPEIALRCNAKEYGAKKVENFSAVFDVALTPGSNLLEISDPSAPGRTLDAMVVGLSAIPAKEGRIELAAEELAVNVGSNCYFTSDADALTWLPDREYSPGSLFGRIGGHDIVSQDEIALTADQPLLQRAAADIRGYRFDVTPGLYEVELLFADLSSPSALSAYMLGGNAGNSGDTPAVMDIDINGVPAERAFAPAASGGVKSRVSRRYHARVDGSGQLLVEFTPSSEGQTLLSAIKIRRLRP